MAWYSLKRTFFDLRALEEPVPPEAALLLQSADVAGYRPAMRRICGELDRARRYRRALAITIFGYDNAHDRSVADDGLAGIVESIPGEHALFPVILAVLLREVTRETDIVTCAGSQARSIVVMPETGVAEAGQAVNRLRELCAARLKVPIRAGFAVFPQHGLTLEELLRYAGEDAKRCVRDASLIPSIESLSA
jgi:hypothetical protein